jgi:hypothetical protein
MADGGRIFCERCGTETPLWPNGAIGYCLGCRLFLCATCHDAARVRCFECQRSTTAGSRSAEGMSAAREALRVLGGASVELGRLRTATWRTSDAAPADGDEALALARIKAAAAAAASEHALAHVRPQFGDKAEQLRQELMLVKARVGLLSEVPEPSSQGSDLVATLRTSLASASRRARDARPAVLVAAVVFLASVGSILAVSLGLTYVPPGGENLASEPTVREEIAGSTPRVSVSPASIPASSGSIPAIPAAAQPIADDRFDDLAMGSALGPEWSIAGSRDDVIVAAFPTAVDRSLQLRRGPQALRLCRLGAPGSAIHSVTVDFLFDPAVPTNARLLRIPTATGGVELATTEGSSLVLNVAGDSTGVMQVAPMTWYRAIMEAGDGNLRVSLSDPQSGAETFQIEVSLQAGLTSDQVCFELPAGAAADLYIDNVKITT